jgi:uncharacterized linocin/CFP29 family protein
MSTATLTLPPTVMMNNGRDKVHWSKEVWERIDRAVYHEAMRTLVGPKFLPLHPVEPKTTTVPSDLVIAPDGANNAGTLTVDEGATTRLIEIWVEFALTPQQVDHETGDPGELGYSTAVTLATRAANILSQAEDVLIFQGRDALTSNNLFGSLVRHRGEPADEGLLNERPDERLPPDQIITVGPVSTDPLRYGENTFTAVAEGYSRLQGAGHYGPYALVLHTVPYADTYAPLANTLIMPADRIKPLVTAGFYGTGTLPTSTAGGAPSFRGLLVSLGGNSMDLVVGMDATTAFMQQDVDGAYRFRVLERFALRLKERTAVIRLEFLPNAP